MAKVESVWGIDIGQCALKALKLSDVEGQIQVEAFDVVEHPKVLSEADADRPRLLQEALGRFLGRNSVAGSTVVVSVPGQNSFSAFVKLPPVEPKRIPSIVRFEAEQQIPFPIEEVVWRWQTFHDPDSPDVEVGIFAMKRIDVAEMLAELSLAGLKVDIVQMVPLALYNFMCGDKHLADDGATLLVDVGAEKTDLVVADGARIWRRTLQIGGNNFTEALVRAFKLSFTKAESLKRSAATSKYARQIFQAMRPVFADVVQEIQRSIGYYTSLHRETRFKRVVGMGNGFRLPGLQKFLEQNLNIPVSRIDSYNNLAISPAVSRPTFAENVLAFPVAYGLALQGLEQAVVNTNLLPREVARKRRWDRKRPWFATAAAVLLVAMSCWVYRSYADRTDPQRSEKLDQALAIVKHLEELREKDEDLRDKGGREKDEIERNIRLYGYRNFWPSLLTMLSRSIQAVAVDNPRLAAYATDRQAEATLLGKLDRKTGKKLSPADREGLEKRLEEVRTRIAGFKDSDRSTRTIIVVESLAASDMPQLGLVAGGEGAEASDTAVPQGRGFIVEAQVRTPLPIKQANRFIRDMIRKSKQLADEYPSLSIQGTDILSVERIGGVGPDAGGGKRDERARRDDLAAPAVAAAGPARPDPLIPDEDMADDLRFLIRWLVAVEGDGVPLSEPSPKKPSSAKGFGR